MESKNTVRLVRGFSRPQKKRRPQTIDAKVARAGDKAVECWAAKLDANPLNNLDVELTT